MLLGVADRGEPELSTLPQVLIADLGSGDVESVTSAIDARVRTLAGAPRLHHNAQVSFHTGSAEVGARVRLLDVDAIEPGARRIEQSPEPVVRRTFDVPFMARLSVGPTWARLTPEQKRLAEESKAQLQASARFRRPIVTEITEASTFYPAEDYHQRYLEKRGLASCHI